MNNTSVFIKAFVRIVVDHCLLPGTAHGTEILMLYFRQWNKIMSAIAFIAMSSITYFEIRRIRFNLLRNDSPS